MHTSADTTALYSEKSLFFFSFTVSFLQNTLPVTLYRSRTFRPLLSSLATQITKFCWRFCSKDTTSYLLLPHFGHSVAVKHCCLRYYLDSKLSPNISTCSSAQHSAQVEFYLERDTKISDTVDADCGEREKGSWCVASSLLFL